MSSRSTWFKLEPVDACFFRDGTPFNRGENHASHGYLFPPSPSTIVGTMRYSLAAANGWNAHGSWVNSVDGNQVRIVETLGNGTRDLGKLKFCGPIVFHKDQPYFPIPRSVLGGYENDQSQLLRKRFIPKCWNVPGPLLNTDLGKVRLPQSDLLTQASEKSPDVAEDVLVSLKGLERIKNGQIPSANECISSEDLFSVEQRVGIARAPLKRVVQTGMLYNPQFLRLRQHTSIAVSVEGIPETWNEPTLIPFGGEARMARVTKFDWNTNALSQMPDLASSEHAAISLLTPALFAGPASTSNSVKWWGAGAGESASQLSPELCGDIICASIGRPTRIGGWSSIDGGPEDMRPFVSAGSTWWIPIGALKNVNSALIQIGSRCEAGFGLAFVARAPLKDSPNN